MGGIVLNRAIVLIFILFSSLGYTKVKFCSNPELISSFKKDKTSYHQLVDCAKETIKNNLGFKNVKQAAFILGSEVERKIFYFSFPMIHQISFYKFVDGEFIESRSYSKTNNQGSEYVFFDNLNQDNVEIIGITNTQSSIQLPFLTFESSDIFQGFLKSKWMFDGLWFGVVLVTILLAISFFYIRRKVEITYYLMHIVSLFVIQLSFSGYFFSFFNFLPEYFLSRPVVFSCGLLTFGTVGLIHKVFTEQRKNDKLVWIYGGVKYIAIAHFIMCLFFYNQTVIKFTSYLTLLLSLSSIVVCLYAIVRRMKYSAMFLLSFSLFLFSSLVFTLKDLGVMNINEIQANYFVKVSLLVEIFILGLVMVRALFEEARIMTNANMNQLIVDGNIKIIKKLQHDINSPLTSLEYFIAEVKNNMPEELRILGRQSINRIQDIINTLKINEEDRTLEETSEKECVAVYPLLKRIISEKRIEYKTRSDVSIDIETEINKDIFVYISKSDFNRAISNIINNSIEASKKDGPINVKVVLSSGNDQVCIQVEDNGVGIEKRHLKEIFKYGKSINKNSSGIGLNQAKSYIESEDGVLNIDSEIGKGTIIEILLQKVEEPVWFADKLRIDSKIVVIIDDDESIHNLWAKKLSNMEIEIVHLYSSVEFNRWKKQNKLEECTFLVDLELIGSKENGIELIFSNNIESRSTLVTSHYLEKKVQKNCEMFGIKMIPKESVLNIEVTIKSHDFPDEIVLIDDDQFTHLNWKRSAQSYGINLNSFYDVDSFLKESNTFSSETSIYIDSNLGDDQKGEVLSKQIYDLGFNNIILATGSRKEDIQVPYWINKVQGKGFFVQ